MRAEQRPEWALNLSVELKSWIPEHGYSASTELADELSIPRGSWGHIYHGGAILAGGGRGRQFDGRIFYARINLWTELTAADPRNIPDQLIKLPKGGIAFKKRNLSEEDYQKWLESSEAMELLAKKNERFQREAIVMEPFHSPQPTPKETVGSFLGSVVDGLIERGSDQIARLILERQTDFIEPQLSKLEYRITSLESAIVRLVMQASETPRPVRSRTPRAISDDIGQLAKTLGGLLEKYKSGTSEERNNLMQAYGKDLLELDVLVHTLTRRPNEREERLNLTRDTKNL